MLGASGYDAAKVVWPHTTGKGITVALIDSGVRATQVDLRGQILQGTDFAFGGNGQTDHSPEGHGTQMASVIAGHGHGPNGEDGIMGLAPGVKILPIGIGTGVQGQGQDYVPQAIRYAVDHGAQVINMSIGSAGADPVEESAVAYAEQHNVVLVAAAGNDGGNDKQYPASWPGVIKVGAVDKTGKLSSESQTGGITVVAPGVDILSDGAGSDTEMRMAHGTSDATAVVSALAALYRSAHPSLTAGQIVNYIIKTAILPKGLTAPDPGFGYGIASPDFKMAVDAGPAAGPLPQATDPLNQGGTGANSSASPDTSTTASGSGSSSSTIVIVLGALAALVVVVVVIVVIARSRRGGGGGGNSGGPGYPQAQPQYQPQPQAYQPPTGQYGQQPPQNPYNNGGQQYPPQQGYGGNQGR
ncbi:Serine protease, subtilisin family [Streptacidiphilus jiangxiensis]|uniref:Serine protease, subtilisin family n=1 Tax=Streptacidiphilus jiangxiensis TaxID=235985 RepID=A0A1H7S5R3_STRJI|nr:Serine protease, subtilisin family [Streptacidiphilus jiangxiensis]